MNTSQSLNVVKHPFLSMEIVLQIENFLTQYAYSLDDGYVQDWDSFFCDDGFYFVTTAQNEKAELPIGIIYCKGRAMMSDRIIALETANIYESHRYCHNLTKPLITLIDHNIFNVRSNFSVYRTMENGYTDLFATGKYVDQIIFVDDTPRFKERRVILDSKRVDTLLVFPI